MPLFLPLAVLSSAAAVHIRQIMWGQTNRLEKCFVKIRWDSCWILRACPYQARRCSREPDGFKRDAILASAGVVHKEASELFAEISCTKTLWGHGHCCFSLCVLVLAWSHWLNWDCSPSRPLSYLFTYDPTLLCFTSTWHLSLHNFKLLFACSCVVVSRNGSIQVFSVLSSLSQASLGG